MTSKKRILHIIDALGNAGAETQQVTFAEGIDSSRFELRFCGLRPRPGSITQPALQALGMHTLVLNQRNTYDLPALYSLVRYIRRHRIDLIHTHLIAADIMGRLAGLLTHRPVISTIHSVIADLDGEPRRRQLLERWTARTWCRKLVVVSELVRADVASWFGLPLDRVLAIDNAVDTERFRPAGEADRLAVKQELLGGDYPLAITAARLVPNKGHRTLLSAARIVLDKRPDVRFAIVGEGPEAANLKTYAHDLGIEHVTIFTGLRKDVPRLLGASDLFVLPSLWEGMPLSLLEAMSAGCACIGTPVGGVPQLVQHETTGLLVPTSDPEALARAILLLFDNPARARTMGQAARALVLEKFSIKLWARKWENLYLKELGPA